MPKNSPVIVILLLFMILVSACKHSLNEEIDCYTVKKSNFIISVTETGELEAVNSKMIFAPPIPWHIVSNLKITKMVEDGKQVEKDEVLMEFDKSDVLKTISDAEAELEIAKSELRKTKANHESQLDELVTNLAIANLNHKISELNLKLKKYDAEVERKRIELDLEKATINLDKAQQEIENKKSIQKEEINTLDLKVLQAQNKLDEAKLTMEMLTVKAPNPGIAIVEKNWRTGEKFTVNDQTWPGYPLVGLPDLSLMRVKVPINEVDIAKMGMDQKVIVKLDAYPDSSYSGHVTDIATLARLKDRESKVKVFDIIALMDGNDEKLIPGMTVSCEIIVNNILETISIPLDALFKKDGENIVYLKNGSGFEPRKVKLGEENDNFVIIVEGLVEGDAVALVDPTEMSF
ncbi:efflux RND transporter periplasmic adaptor subunit [candidate division KSB1 bacterium]